MSGLIQLKGNLAMSSDNDPPVSPGDDVKNFVSEFRINTTRESEEVPGTLGLDGSVAAGERRDSLTITFHSGVAANSFWASLYEAIGTPSSEIHFSGTFDEGAISVDNLEFSGTAILLSLDSGGTVGELRQQTLTLPIKQGTLSTDDGV